MNACEFYHMFDKLTDHPLGNNIAEDFDALIRYCIYGLNIDPTDVLYSAAVAAEQVGKERHVATGAMTYEEVDAVLSSGACISALAKGPDGNRLRFSEGQTIEEFEAALDKDEVLQFVACPLWESYDYSGEHDIVWRYGRQHIEYKAGMTAEDVLRDIYHRDDADIILILIADRVRVPFYDGATTRTNLLRRLIGGNKNGNTWSPILSGEERVLLKIPERKGEVDLDFSSRDGQGSPRVHVVGNMLIIANVFADNRIISARRRKGNEYGFDLIEAALEAPPIEEEEAEA